MENAGSVCWPNWMWDGLYAMSDDTVKLVISHYNACDTCKGVVGGFYCRFGHSLATLKKYLPAGGDPNGSRNRIDGYYNPVLSAVLKANDPDTVEESVELLLRYGANPNMTDTLPGWNRTPYSHMVKFPDFNMRIFKMLIRAGARYQWFMRRDAERGSCQEFKEFCQKHDAQKKAAYLLLMIHKRGAFGPHFDANIVRLICRYVTSLLNLV